jgi:hypothetical protein
VCGPELQLDLSNALRPEGNPLRYDVSIPDPRAVRLSRAKASAPSICLGHVETPLTSWSLNVRGNVRILSYIRPAIYHYNVIIK